MENLLNTFHYSIYLIDRKLHFLSNKVNPFLLLYKIPFLKRKAEQKGENLYEIYNNTFTDKVSGFNIWVAGGILISTVMFLQIGIFTIAVKPFDIVETINGYHLLFFGALSLYICYLYVFKNDKYLTYFSKYETWTRGEKRKYVALVFIVILAVVALNFFSLLYFFS